MNVANIYETNELISQYLDFQYGDNTFGMENFAVVCAHKAIGYSKGTQQAKALDLGCATGRASFELTLGFDHVDGVDYSHAFVDAAVELRQKGQMGYAQNGEGDLKNQVLIDMTMYPFRDTCIKAQFFQGDACVLEAQFSGYDLVMATNLVDRLYQPQLFLTTIHERINEGGVLVLTSPYTWREEYTQKQFWLGGYVNEKGVEVASLDGLKKILEANFELIATEDIPFVIRETARKF